MRRVHQRVEQRAHHVALDAVLQVVEHLLAFALVHNQRVALAVGVQADARPQVLHGREVLHPVGIYGPQQQEPLDQPHLLRADFFLPLSIGGLGVGRQYAFHLLTAVLIDVVLVLQFRRQWADLAQLVNQPLGVPVVGVAARQVLGQQAGELLSQHPQRLFAQVTATEGLVAVDVDNLPLLVQHVVEFQQVLANVEVVALHLDLGAADGLGDQFVLHRGILFQSGPTHDALDALAAEPLHQLVFQGHVELGTAGVALASGAAPKLIVDAAGVVMLGADDEQPAQLDHSVVFLLPVVSGCVGAAQHDVGAAPGHVGGHGDSAQPSGLGDDAGLALVVLGVQHLVRNAAFP